MAINLLSIHHHRFIDACFSCPTFAIESRRDRCTQHGSQTVLVTLRAWKTYAVVKKGIEAVRFPEAARKATGPPIG